MLLFSFPECWRCTRDKTLHRDQLAISSESRGLGSHSVTTAHLASGSPPAQPGIKNPLPDISKAAGASIMLPECVLPHSRSSQALRPPRSIHPFPSMRQLWPFQHLPPQSPRFPPRQLASPPPAPFSLAFSLLSLSCGPLSAAGQEPEPGRRLRWSPLC